MDGASGAVAEPVASGWGKPVLRLAVCPLAVSLARGRVAFTRRASTQAKSRTRRRGVESVKFGRATACLQTERAGTKRSGSRAGERLAEWSGAQMQVRSQAPPGGGSL